MNLYVPLGSSPRPWAEAPIIGKYLSRLCKLDHVIAPKEGFEAQLQASRLSIPCGMRALGMTRQIRDGLLQGGIEPRLIPALHSPDNGTEDMDSTQGDLARGH